MTDLQNFVNGFGLGISKEELASEAYNAMEALGHKVVILNSKYLIVDEIEYQFTKSSKQGAWIVKEI